MLDFRAHKLKIKAHSGGGLDKNGDPTPVKETWGDPIPCHYDTDGRDTIYKYPDGSQTVFEYAVWLDPIPDDLTGLFICLIDQYGNVEVDEKQVQKCVNGQLRTKLYL